MFIYCHIKEIITAQTDAPLFVALVLSSRSVY
jgi:hypothetical protein